MPNENGNTNGGDGGNTGTPPAPNTNGDNNGTPPAGNTPPATGTPPASNGDSNGGGNTVELTPEQLAAAFNHPRFKELNEKAKKADELVKAQEDAERKRLEEAGEHKKLADQYKADAESAKTALETERKNNALIVAANKMGAHDASVVAKLIDGGKLTIKEDGTVEGADAALTELQKTNPYLFKTGSTTSVGGSDTNPSGGGNAEFTYSQFKDADYYKENQAAMDKALKENRVDMTR